MPRLPFRCPTPALLAAGLTLAFTLALAATPALASSSGSSERLLDVQCYNTSSDVFCGAFTQKEDLQSDMSSYCSKLAATCSEKFAGKCPAGQARAEFSYYMRTDKKSVHCN